MIIHISPFIQLAVKNLWRKKSGATWYYRRRIPKDVAELLNLPSGHTKTVCLFITDDVTATKAAIKLAVQDEADWERLRSGKAALVHEQAINFLGQFGITVGTKPSEFEHDAFVQHIEKLLGGEGQERVYRGEDPVELLDNPVAAAALRLARGEFTVSHALEFYLELRGKGKPKDFFKQSRIAVAQLVESAGDREFLSFRRADANTFVKRSLDRGGKTNTVKRRISVLSALFNVVIREKELDLANPFDKVLIPGEGSDTAKRMPFGEDQQEIFRRAVAEAPAKDDLSQMLAMLLDTGARLAEIVGLRVDDVVLDAEIPYVKLVNHDHRRLKNGSSVRDIPLVGAALTAATKAAERANRSRSDFLFNRYTSKDGCDAHTASATLNKRIRSLGIDLTCHSLRHTIRDRLREVECPREIIDRIGGWSSSGVGERYGLGYRLDVLSRWLSKAVTKDSEEKFEPIVAIGS